MEMQGFEEQPSSYWDGQIESGRSSANPSSGSFESSEAVVDTLGREAREAEEFDDGLRGGFDSELPKFAFETFAKDHEPRLDLLVSEWVDNTIA